MSFVVGDRVKITHKVPAPGLGWNEEMDGAIGKIGTIGLPYTRFEEIIGYKVTLDKAKEIGHRSVYTYPTDSITLLDAEVASTIEVGDIVHIFEKPEDAKIRHRSNWDENMDDLVGLDAQVTKKQKLGGHDVYFLDVFTEDGIDNDFYFPGESLQLKTKGKGSPEKSKKVDKWYLGNITGLPYKYIRTDEFTGTMTLQDSYGDEVSNEYMRFNNAPRECKGFDWRPNE